MRKLKFDLDVKTAALVCPNPNEFYARAYISENVANNFRAIPGVKNKEKVANVIALPLLKPAGCSWSAIDTELDAKQFEVTAFDAMAQICQRDLEASFVSLQMAKGDANWEVASFMNHYWGVMKMQIAEEIQDIRWNGDTTLVGDTYLKEVDGYIKLMVDSADVIKKDSTPFTTESIVLEITKAVLALPEAIKGKKADVRIYMNADSAMLYSIATLSLNTNFNYTGELSLTFAGFQISIQENMPANTIVVALKDDLIYLYDGEADSSTLKAVNLADTTNEPIIRTKASFKIGFGLLNEDQIVLLAPDVEGGE